MVKKSLTKNAILSAGQKLLSILFPLITFPYISRILAIDDIGKINFSTSIISYFLLISGLGINNYAVREGSKIKNNKKELEKFSSEMLSINMISTVIAYALLLTLYFLSSTLQSYKLLMLIQSFSIIGTTIGVNWIYSIEENYSYITIRTILVQIISLILMFVFVKKRSDYILYAIITVFSNVGANIFNYIHAKKYIKFRLTLNLNIRKHLKPILIIFTSSIAAIIYVESDVTILGLLCGEYYVGLYSRATKIYTIIKQVVVAIVIVALPNLSSVNLRKNSEIFIKKANKIFYNMLFLALPISIGIFLTSKSIVVIAAGENYYEAATSLSILGLSFLFAVLSSFLTYCCLLPMKLEKIQMFATLISALVNIILNFLLIPFLSQNGAALTTLISEIIVFIIEGLCIIKMHNFRRIFNIKNKYKMALLLGVSWIISVNLTISIFKLSLILDFIIKVILSIIGYVCIMLLLDYPMIRDFVKNIFYRLYKMFYLLRFKVVNKYRV